MASARHGLGAVVYSPCRERVLKTNLRRLADKVMGPSAYDAAAYSKLHRWSVSESARFWGLVFEDLNLTGSLGVGATPQSRWPRVGSPSVEWFPDAEVNHAEILLEGKGDEDVALIVTSEAATTRREVTYAELRLRTAQMAESLHEDGVRPGTRVAGVVNNDDDAVVAMLATTSLGASWSSISSDFGEKAIVDRLSQVEPVVLFAHSTSTYRGKTHDVLAKLGALNLPSVKRYVNFGDAKRDGWLLAQNYSSTDIVRPRYSRGGFDREVYVMFSSGTTGKPKCLAQGVGVTLGHAKESAYHFDLRPGDRSLWVTTCGWMMWNWLLGATLTTGGAACLFDGDPLCGGDLFRIFQLSHDCALFGSSAKHLSACSKTIQDLSVMSRLRVVGSTGSPCAGTTFDWAERVLTPMDVPLVSTSGGTDLNGSFATGCPWLPVRRESLQCAGLGLDVAILDDASGTVQLDAGVPGELACLSPFPSAPLRLLNDENDRKYRASYFADDFGGGQVWRHGDWAHRDVEGGFVIHGRSDATLNPGGVRIGTAEIYNALLSPEDALVAAQPFTNDDGVRDVRIVLFIVPTADPKLAARLESIPLDSNDLVELARPPKEFVADICRRIKSSASPRHVPYAVCWCPKIPTTSNGKKLEIAVNKALGGDKDVVSRTKQLVEKGNTLQRLKKDDAEMTTVKSPTDYFVAIAPLVPDLAVRR